MTYIFLLSQLPTNFNYFACPQNMSLWVCEKGKRKLKLNLHSEFAIDIFTMANINNVDGNSLVGNKVHYTIIGYS